MRRELLLTLLIVAIILGYVAWGMSNATRTGQVAPATPTAQALAAALSPTPEAPVATQPARVVAPVVAMTTVTTATVDTTTVATATVALPTVSVAATAVPVSATITAPVSSTLGPALALAATALAPETQPGAGTAEPPALLKRLWRRRWPLLWSSSLLRRPWFRRSHHLLCRSPLHLSRQPGLVDQSLAWRTPISAPNLARLSA